MRNRGTLNYADPTMPRYVRKPRPQKSNSFAIAASICAAASLLLMVTAIGGGMGVPPFAVLVAIPIFSLASIPLTAGAFAASSRQAAMFALLVSLLSLFAIVSLGLYVVTHLAIG